MNAIVLDLETIPDSAIWTPPTKEAPKDPHACDKCGLAMTPEDAGTRKCTKMQRGRCRFPDPPKDEKDEFPPIRAHKIVCCGMALLTDDMPSGLVVWGARPDTDEERGLLMELNKLLTSLPDTGLVTWYGRGFDIPVIEARSLRYGLTQSWLTSEYFKPAPWPNCDLQAILGGRDKLPLHDAARLIGLPGKNGMDGSMVKGLIEAGQLNTAKEYCGRDVVQTAFLYLRYRLLRGFIDAAKYRDACKQLGKTMETAPGFNDFPIDFSVLLPAA